MSGRWVLLRALLIVWFCVKYSADRAVLQDTNYDSAFENNSRDTRPRLKRLFSHTSTVEQQTFVIFGGFKKPQTTTLTVPLTTDIAHLQM